MPTIRASLDAATKSIDNLKVTLRRYEQEKCISPLYANNETDASREITTFQSSASFIRSEFVRYGFSTAQLTLVPFLVEVLGTLTRLERQLPDLQMRYNHLCNIYPKRTVRPPTATEIRSRVPPFRPDKYREPREDDDQELQFPRIPPP